ncbi:MAG: M16 family metallopeptidase [Terriglobales bacterium]
MNGMHRWMRVLCCAVLAGALSAPMFGQMDAAKPQAAKGTKTAAVAKGAPMAEKLPTIKYEKYKLKNGLEVILSEDHRLPLVAVDLWYHVGPANEKPGRTGFAHLFEHMMFQGSKHAGDKPFQVLEGAGATLINGTTDFDRTNFFETMPANQLQLALWLESDRMGWLLDRLDEKKLANQRAVVRNERRQGENQPYEVVDEALWHSLFPQGHPYYGDVIGSHADIEAAQLTDVRDFFKTYYAPNNCTLAIVGDYDPKTIKALVEKYFAPIPSGPAPEKMEVKQPVITEEKKITVTDKITLPRISMAWQSPAIFKPGDAEADLLASALGAGRSSRLYKDLVYDKQIAQNVSVNQQSLMLGSVFEIDATAKPGVKLEDLQAAIEKDLAEIQKTGPTKEELERARNTIVTRRIQGMQRLGGFGGVADVLNQYNHYTGDPGFMAKDIARYTNATADSVRKFAQTLTDNSRVIAYAEPGEKHLEDVPERKVDPNLQSQAMPGGPGNDAWRATPPPPGPVKAPNLPQAAEFKLPNGLTVLLVEDHKLPVMTAQLAIRSGGDENPADLPGLASFTASTLMEGTAQRPSELKLADDIAMTGGFVGSGSSYDSSSITASGLTWHSNQFFDLLSDVAMHPAFPQEEIERLRQRRMVSLMQQKDNPNTLATKAFYREIYGDKSPYGYLDNGTEASTKSTTREDMEKFYKAGYGPKNAVLSVAGDFTVPQLKALTGKYFGGWTGEAAKHAAPEISSTTEKRIVLVDKPGANQSALRIGEMGLARSNPDFVAVNVMNDILGGLFSSRINLNLREVHGYTYGAFTGFQFRRGAGPFMVGSMIRADATAPAITEVFKELDKMRATEPTAAEMNMAKESYVRGLTAIFETTQQTSGTMANLFVYDLPLNYYSELPKKIEAVTAADVQQMAEKYLHPDKMVIVIAGDKSKIESDVRALNMKTDVQDAEGKPIEEKSAAPSGRK